MRGEEKDRGTDTETGTFWTGRQSKRLVINLNFPRLKGMALSSSLSLIERERGGERLREKEREGVRG